MKKKYRFFASIPMMIAMIIILIVGFGLLIFIFSEPERYENFTWIIYVIFAVFLGIFPLFAFIITAHRWFSIIEITEKGIKKSLFKIFQKTEIAWSEISEIRFCSRVGYWLLISKTKLDGVYYDDIVKRKDVIQIEFNKKIYHILRQYWKEEIINLPKNIEQSIRSK